jgi:hypothetical protein
MSVEWSSRDPFKVGYHLGITGGPEKNVKYQDTQHSSLELDPGHLVYEATIVTIIFLRSACFSKRSFEMQTHLNQFLKPQIRIYVTYATCTRDTCAAYVLIWKVSWSASTLLNLNAAFIGQPTTGKWSYLQTEWDTSQLPEYRSPITKCSQPSTDLVTALLVRIIHLSEIAMMDLEEGNRFHAVSLCNKGSETTRI